MDRAIEEKLLAIEAKLAKHPFPPQLVIENTSACDQQCIHCSHKELIRPKQSSNIESLNCKFKDECLTDHWFESLPQAGVTITTWQQNYNNVRPHSSCRRMPPSKFAALRRHNSTDAKQHTTEIIL